MTGDAVAVRILLVRHAESLLNALGRVQGWADSPLTDCGRAAATRLGARLGAEGVRLAAVHAADGMRHRETAELVSAAAGSSLHPVVDSALREIGFGAFEGAPNADLRAALGEPAHADLGDRLARLPARSLALGAIAEEPDAVRARMVGALDRLARSTAAAGGGEALAVSSGISIWLALGAFGADPSTMRGGIRNAAVSVVRWSGGEWDVERVNDAAGSYDR